MTRRVLLQISQGTASPDAFTPRAQASFFPDQAKEAGRLLNTLSLPIAIIFTNELIERRDENGLCVYRYALTDIGKSVFCTIKLTEANKIDSLTCN